LEYLKTLVEYSGRYKWDDHMKIQSLLFKLCLSGAHLTLLNCERFVGESKGADADMLQSQIMFGYEHST
jgi:hypothetical protein